MLLLFVYLKTQMSSWLGETDEGDGEGERVVEFKAKRIEPRQLVHLIISAGLLCRYYADVFWSM